VPTETFFSATHRSGRLTQTRLEEINKRTETTSNREGSKPGWRIEKANKQDGEIITIIKHNCQIVQLFFIRETKY